MWKPRRGTPAVHGGHLAAAVRSAMALSGPGCPRCLPGRQLVGYGAAPRLSSGPPSAFAEPIGAVTERGRSWSAAGAGHTRPVPTASCAYKYRSSPVPSFL